MPLALATALQFALIIFHIFIVIIPDKVLLQMVTGDVYRLPSYLQCGFWLPVPGHIIIKLCTLIYRNDPLKTKLQYRKCIVNSILCT